MVCSSPFTFVSVGPIKENNGFKKCICRVETAMLKDTETHEVIREAEQFDCEVALRDVITHTQLNQFLEHKQLLPGIFKLRAFFYTEKNVQKLGKQLVLKRWWK